MKHKFNKDKILKFFKKRFKSERGVGTATVLLGLMILSLIILAVNGKDAGDKGLEIKKSIKDPGQYADIIGPETVKLDEETLTVRDETNKKIINHAIELVKTPMTVVDDTQVLTILEQAGVFKVKKKNIEEEDKKTETNLKNNGLPSDKLNVAIAKIVKAKIENNSTPGTSSEEIDDMMIKIMEDIEDQEDLFDAMEEVDAIVDMVSLVEEILENNDKLADQKIIDIKSNLNRAESEKKYLEAIINASKDAESKGGFLADAQGIRDAKARLEENEKIINDLKTELQQYEDRQEEESEEITEEVTAEVITLNGTLVFINPNPVTLGEAVSCSTNITNDDYTYKWNLGDGTKLDEVGLYKTEHVYSLEGMYPISVEIYDGKDELVGKATQNVTVAPPEVTEVTTSSNSEVVGTWFYQSDVYFFYYDNSVSYVIITFVLNGDGTCSYEYLPVVLREPSEEIEPQERIDLAAMYKVNNPGVIPPEYESAYGTYVFLEKGSYFEEHKRGAATMLYTSASYGEYEYSDNIYLMDTGRLVFSSTEFTRK